MFDMRSSQSLSSPGDGDSGGDDGQWHPDRAAAGGDANRRPTKGAATASQVMVSQAPTRDSDRFADQLHRIQGRIGDLHALQLSQEEALGQLAARIDGLAVGTTPDTEHDAAAQRAEEAHIARADALAATIAALQAETALLRDQVADLTAREPHPSRPAGAALDGLIQRLELTEDALAALQARADAVGPAQGSTGLERRIEAAELAQERRVETLAAELRQRQDAETADTDRRLRRLALALGLPLGLLALLLPVLFGAVWWHADQRFSIMDLRLEGLSEQVASRPPQDAGPAIAPALAQLDQIQSTLAAMHDQAATAPLAEPAEPAEPAELAVPAAVAAVPTASSAADTVRAPASPPVEPEQGTGVDDRGTAQGPETPQDAAVRGSPRVLAEPRWMIQLIGFQSLDRAFEFAASYGLAGRAWTLTGRWRGQPWYSVLIEPHTDRAAVAAAFDALPSALRALDPLVRRLEAGTRLEPID